jgi:hypothetical protein
MICYIYIDNNQSMKANVRYGFRPYKRMLILKLFRWSLKYQQRI